MPLQANVDLGVLTQGETIVFRQWLKNQTDRELQIAAAVPSCDCLSVRFNKAQVEPKSQVLAEFSYDGAKEPDFTGGLAIEVVVTDNDKQEIGKITVAVEVIKPMAEMPPTESRL